MGNARLPFFFPISLVFLLTQVALSWAAPTPDYIFTLFGLPITIYTGNGGGEGDNGKPITTSKTVVRTPVETTTHTSPHPTITHQQASAITTHAAIPTKTGAATHSTVDSPKTADNVAAGARASSNGRDSSTQTAPVSAPPALPTDLPTDTAKAGSNLVLSTMTPDQIAASSSAGVISAPSSPHNQAALVVGLVIPLVLLLLLLSVGIAYRRRRDRTKQQMIMRALPSMHEATRGADVEGAWRRLDGDPPWGFTTPPPPPLTLPSRTLDVTSPGLTRTHDEPKYLTARSDDGHSAAGCLTLGAPTDDGHSLPGHVHASIFGESSFESEWSSRFQSEPALAERPTSMTSVFAGNEKRRSVMSQLLVYDRFSEPPPAYHPRTPKLVSHLE
ncbi:hypothetical protein B0H19DRAFT_523458 [Mycena capillaripes]|nr:hypothetical protein B0H19DRAFT_523458 [Mycena capillaripes]